MRLLLALSLAALAACRSTEPPAPADHPRLAALYADDQADRAAEPPAGLSARDARRRADVQALIDRGALRTGADHYRAAMVLQHGEDSTAYASAHRLASEAVARGYDAARWLQAASLDRYLLSVGRPQRYGTQFLVRDGRWYLWLPFDSLAVTDDERARAGARTLPDLRRFLAVRNQVETWSLSTPPPPRDPSASVEVLTPLDSVTARVRHRAPAPLPTGSVVVEVEVSIGGSAQQVDVVAGLRPDVDALVVEAVRRMRFVNRRGEPWSIRMRVPVGP